MVKKMAENLQECRRDCFMKMKTFEEKKVWDTVISYVQGWNSNNLILCQNDVNAIIMFLLFTVRWVLYFMKKNMADEVLNL